MNDETAALLAESERLLREDPFTTAQPQQEQAKKKKKKKIVPKQHEQSPVIPSRPHSTGEESIPQENEDIDDEEQGGGGGGGAQIDIERLVNELETGEMGEGEENLPKKKKMRKKRKNLKMPNFGDRLKRNTEAEIQRDEKELIEEAERTETGNKGTTSAKNNSTLPLHSKWKISSASTLIDREWENELARSILALYNANQGKKSPNEGSRKRLPAIKSEPGLQVQSSSATTGKRLRQPTQIWFSGSGVIKAVWCSLADDNFEPDPRMKRFSSAPCKHPLCVELRDLEMKSQFESYIEKVTKVLQDFSRKKMYIRAERKQEERRKKDQLRSLKVSTVHGSCERSTWNDSNDHVVLNGPREVSSEEDPGSPKEFDKELEDSEDDYFIDYETIDPSVLSDPHGDIMERMMWRQLVVCCTVFGVKYTDKGKFGTALNLFKRGENMLESTSAMEGGSAFLGTIKFQLRGFVFDSLAYYYFRRKKSNAAAFYAQKAMRAHVKLEQWQHVAKCHLHCGTILSMMGKHDDAIQCLGQVLQMVEDERLEVGGTNAQKICMIAVCYHNIAVEQLILRRPAEACVSTQNARRLARLSLSYANRWVNTFENTHQFALIEISTQHAYVNRHAAASGKSKKYSASGQPNKSVRESLKNPKARRLYEDISKSILT